MLKNLSLLFIVILIYKKDVIIEQLSYTVQITSSSGGSVSSSGGSCEGSEISITAIPNSQYRFSNWSNGSTQNPLVLR